MNIQTLLKTPAIAKDLFVFLMICLLVSHNGIALAETSTSETAQHETKMQKITIVLHDGTQLFGELISLNKDEVTLESSLGKLTLKRSQIKSMQFMNDLPKSSKSSSPRPSQTERPKNPTDTRLFFAPTARNLKQGKGYIQDIYVFIGAANYGVTDNFSIGGMATFIPFLPIDSQVFALTPKYSFEIDEKNHFAVGGLYALSSSTIGQLGLGYGLYTFGDSDSNITLGAGVGSSFDSFASPAAFAMLGGMHRINDNMAIITENWLATAGSSQLVIPSLGIRFFGGNLSADFALAYPIASFGVLPFPLPYLDFVFSF